MSLAVAEKTCSACGATKSLSEFYRHKRTSDGRASRCKDCHKESVRRSQEKRRAELGDEAYRAEMREYQRKWREQHPEYEKDRLQQQAWSAALKRLKAAHLNEFEGYYREERYERGLSI